MSVSTLLIGVPAWDGIRAEAQEAFCGLCYALGTSRQVQLGVKIVTRREQFRARNELVSAAIGSGYDWLLMLDDDMLPPPDLFERLAAHDKDIIGALYWQRQGAENPVVMRIPEGQQRPAFLPPDAPELTTPGLYQVDVIGGGCLLAKTRLLATLPFPVFWPDLHFGTDIGLCLRLRQLGIAVWIDTRVQLGHLGPAKIIVGGAT
jgi:GT2 family glycosyltransferase